MTASTTLESEPRGIDALFGERAALARDFAAHLAEQGERLGLIGPLEAARLWTRHIVNCALLGPLLRPGLVADVGSGAGLPGLVVAIARPDVRFVLIEPMERRVDWLNSEVQRLALDNVEVLRARAQEVSRARPFDQLTARAVSSFDKLLPMTAPLVRPGGELLFMKGERVDQEIAGAAKAIRRWSVRDVEVLVLGDGIAAETTRVLRATVGTA